MPFIRPSPLKPGDKVAIVSPSAGLPFIFPWVYEQGLTRMRELFQLEPVEYPSARASPDYLAKNPKARADDINAAFADLSIRAIIATIGGSDQVKILPYLDKAVIESNPKIFMGYSDCTNLHLFLWNLGLISYYGGAVMTQFAAEKTMRPFTRHSIERALFHPAIGPLLAAAEYSDIDLDWANKENLGKERPMMAISGWEWHNHHNAPPIEGKLWGGCLEVLHFHLCIKRYLPSLEQLENTILFIETSEEMPSSGFVYRFIAALAELGMLQKFKALLVGYPKAQFFQHTPSEGKAAFIASQQTAIKHALRDYGVEIPTIFNMNFGHTDPQLILPSGGTVRINCQAQTIECI